MRGAGISEVVGKTVGNKRDRTLASSSIPAGPLSPARPRRTGRRRLDFPEFVLGASLLALLGVAVVASWQHRRKTPAPPAVAPAPASAPIPASLEDDEPHSLARARADYERWREQMIRWIRGDDGGVGQAKRLDPAAEARFLPPIEAARACLQRHLHRGVTIDALEPVGFDRAGDGVAIDYRATVRSPYSLYVVPAVPVPIPADGPPPYIRTLPYLLLSHFLPPGYLHDFGKKFLVLPANQPLSFRWRVERARVVDGRWKILLAAPALLQWDCSFYAAELMAIREGNPLPLHLAGDRCLEPDRRAYWETVNGFLFHYDSVWGVPGAWALGYAARAQAMLPPSPLAGWVARNPILRLEAVRPVSGACVALARYPAATDWAGPILAPARQLAPRDAEFRFVQAYRDLAEARNRAIDGFLRQRARFEADRNKIRLPR